MNSLVYLNNNSRVIDVDIEGWEAILNQEIVVEYNTVYVCKEAKDFIMSVKTMALMFKLDDMDIHNVLIKYSAQRDKWGMEEIDLNIKTTYSDGRQFIRRGINRELALYIAFNTNSMESIAIQEFVNQVVENHIYNERDQLTGMQKILELPNAKDKLSAVKNNVLRDVQKEVLSYKKSLYPNSGKRWSTKEDYQIVAMLENDVDIDEISNFLDRPVKAVVQRINKRQLQKVSLEQRTLFNYEEN